MLFSADKEGANVWGIKALFWPDRFFRWWKKVWDKIAPYEVETEEDSALVTELKNAHGVQITTRFGGHETLFAYRELGRRAIVALSGIQAPNRAYGKTNGEGNTKWKPKTVA